jgi:serine/threonine-protein kinase RsbW
MTVDPELNEATVGLARGPLAAPVLGRVVGILAARADCPIDRLDDALLVADAVAAKAASFSSDGRVNVRVMAEPGSVELRVGPLRPDGADGLIASASLPGIGNVLERVADELEQQPGDNGDDEYLRIRLGFGAQRQSTKAPEEADAP